jgi:hypothetical protein
MRWLLGRGPEIEAWQVEVIGDGLGADKRASPQEEVAATWTYLSAARLVVSSAKRVWLLDGPLSF